MDVVDLYLRAGFGVMGWVSASGYDRSQSDPLADSMAEIIQHINAPHALGSFQADMKVGAIDPRRCTYPATCHI